MDSEVDIKDNFLSEEELEKLKNHIYYDMTWRYTDSIDYEDDRKDKETFQFFHSYIHNGVQISDLSSILPILDKINPFIVHRIKINLLTRTPSIIENSFHIDILLKNNKLKHWTTSIFYVNSNDGYTKFRDGTKIESIKNRLISFPSNIPHLGTTCSNKKNRITINFNYYGRN